MSTSPINAGKVTKLDKACMALRQSRLGTELQATQTNLATAETSLSTAESNVTALQATAPTADEKAALAGVGTPSGSNKFLNNDDARLPTTNEKAGIAANTPTAANPLQTAAEITTHTGVATAHHSNANDPSAGEKTAIWVDGYDDCRVSTTFTKKGTSDPTYVGVRSGHLAEFNTNNELFFTGQLPHTYKEGSNLLLHLHWTHSRGVAEDTKTVNWRVDLSVISVNGVFLAGTTYDLTETCDGVDYKHQISSSVTVSGTGLKVSSILIGRIYRAAGDSWATNTNGNKPALCGVDRHYQIDTFSGSVAEYPK